MKYFAFLHSLSQLAGSKATMEELKTQRMVKQMLKRRMLTIDSSKAVTPEGLKLILKKEDLSLWPAKKINKFRVELDFKTIVGNEVKISVGDVLANGLQEAAKKEECILKYENLLMFSGFITISGVLDYAYKWLSHGVYVGEKTYRIFPDQDTSEKKQKQFKEMIKKKYGYGEN